MAFEMHKIPTINLELPAAVSKYSTFSSTQDWITLSGWHTAADVNIIKMLSFVFSAYGPGWVTPHA